MHDLWNFFTSLCNSIKRELYGVFVEEAETSPETCSTAIFVLAFDVEVALIDAWSSAWSFAEVDFGHSVA